MLQAIRIWLRMASGIVRGIIFGLAPGVGTDASIVIVMIDELGRDVILVECVKHIREGWRSGRCTLRAASPEEEAA